MPRTVAVRVGNEASGIGIRAGDQRPRHALARGVYGGAPRRRRGRRGRRGRLRWRQQQDRHRHCPQRTKDGRHHQQQIVRASRDVLSKFSGRVPETVSGLRSEERPQLDAPEELGAFTGGEETHQ